MAMTSGGTSQGYHTVFVYGSLLADEVVKSSFNIKGRVYPAILPVENNKVLGRVLNGVSNLELDILDIFEDVEYARDSVEVTLVDTLEKKQAYAYVWDNKDDPDLYGEWDFENWKCTCMNDFIEMTKEFVEELEHSESKSRVETYKSFYQSTDDNSSMP
ncbi:AIG2-like protein D [Bienertia sinuspersici]